jgi:hypothetical protein
VTAKKRIYLPNFFDAFPPDQWRHLFGYESAYDNYIVSLSPLFFTFPATSSGLRLSPRILLEYQPKYLTICGRYKFQCANGLEISLITAMTHL